ncbi:SDR family NAD(P)-dependent oxidoreductase, partial [Streptomyces misionensis]|uniref:SDR family NAD(P)-dependent oxidoreductase n=1 Tax=Streptomyces misionensis TaxID=67331 RepID=UPI0033D70160
MRLLQAVFHPTIPGWIRLVPAAPDGKTAVVTGAARGIGYAYCRRLAADGAHVVAVGIDDPVDAVRELTGGGDKLGLMCDISEPSQVDAVTSTVLDRYGR